MLTIFGLKLTLAALVWAVHSPLAFAQPQSLPVTVCLEGPVVTTDPGRMTDTVSENAVARSVFDRLVEFDGKKNAFLPGLASSWSFSKDGRDATFKLRRGVRFHRSSDPSRAELTADDVVASFERFTGPQSGLFGLPNSHGWKDMVKAVEVLDSHTVRIRLQGPNSNLLPILSHSAFSVSSREGIEGLTKDPDFLPIGTGPFQFERRDSDQSLRFRRHDAYFRGPAQADRLNVVGVPDGLVRVQKLKSGECHLITEVNANSIEGLRSEPDFRIEEAAGTNIGYLGFHTERAPFNRREVRLAVARAIDRERLVRVGYEGRAVLAKSLLAKESAGFDPKMKTINLDRAAAARELTTLLGTDRQKLKLLVIPISRPYNPSGKRIAELIQDDLKQVGFEVELVQSDWAGFIKRANQGDFDMVLLGGVHNTSDPLPFMDAFLSCAGRSRMNTVRFCNPEFDRLLTKARVSPWESKERAAAIRRANEIFMAEMPFLPLAHGSVLRARTSRLKGYSISPTARENYSKLAL
jgi:dipeptide transport system substrate-binding protein